MTKEEKDNFLGSIPELKGLLDFMESRGVEITSVLVLVLLVLGGTVGYRNWTQRRADDASLRFARAQTVQDLDDLVTDFPNKPLSAAALLRAAKWHYEQGGYEPAMRRYEDFLQRFPEHPFALAATLGLLKSQEAIGMIDAALAGYQRFIEGNPGHFLLPQAEMSLARVLERTGRQQEAVEVYEQMAANYADTGWEDFALEKLELFELQANQPLAAAVRPVTGVPEMQMAPMTQPMEAQPASDEPMEPLISLDAEQLRQLQEEAVQDDQTVPLTPQPETGDDVTQQLEMPATDDSFEVDSAVEALPDADDSREETVEEDDQSSRRRGLLRRRTE